MNEERNYQYELFLKEKENKELMEIIEDLRTLQYAYISETNIKQKKKEKIYPAFVWSVSLTAIVYILILLIKEPFPTLFQKVLDLFSYFEFFGVGCAFYFLVYWLYTRKIVKKKKVY